MVRRFIGLLAVTLLIAFTVLTLAACTSDCKDHADLDCDGVCELCREQFADPGHTDGDGDWICDVCGEDVGYGGIKLPEDMDLPPDVFD